MLRASVTANNIGLTDGDSAEILIDGSETAVTANGLGGYLPSPGDRLLVGRVGSQMEILQFLSTGSIPFSDPITAEKITGAINEDDVYVGDNITISSTTGITLDQSDGGVTRLPTDGSSPQFTGKVLAREIVIENGASIYGVSDVSGTLDLNASVKDPTVAPDVFDYYETIGPIQPSGAYPDLTDTIGLCRNLADDGWVTVAADPSAGANRWRFVERLDVGTVNTYPVFNWGQNAMGGIVTFGGAYYWMYRTGATTWRFAKQSLLSSPSPNSYPFSAAWSSRPGLAADGSAIYTARFDTAVTDVRVDVWDGTLSLVDSQFLASGLTSKANIYGLYYGPADYGSTRFVISYSSALRVYNTTPSGGYDGTYSASDSWPLPYGWYLHGLHWDGTNFWQMDPYGTIVKLEPKATLTDSWWAYTWVDSDTHTTLPSPRTQWSPPSRSLAYVLCGTPPNLGDPGTHIADRIQIYAASSNVATLYEQGTKLAAGVFFEARTPVRSTAVAAPGASNWLAVSVPGEVRSDALDGGGVERRIRLQGDGAWRLGQFAGLSTAHAEGPCVGTIYRATSAATTSLTSGTVTVVGGWTGDDAIGVDSGRYFSSYSSGQWFMDVAGSFTVNATASFATSGTNRRGIFIYKNGAEVRRHVIGAGAAGVTTVQVTHSLSLAVGDTIEVRVLQDSGGALALSSSVSHQFQMVRIL